MARILIADDDVAYRKAFCDGLTVMGHQADGVPDGASALEALKAADYDVVFLDVIMRGGGAITLVHDVKVAFPDVKIVVISGQPHIYDTPLFRDGFRFADARLKKDASLQQIHDTVQTCLQ
ncbi:hypothetical protein GCM10011360_01610 [Primorskyibacter flagellatus]|uniref:Response regulatory domain-containing protein n=1 Tax=Primorskyibacter flagellatus TaxID=1387277 RepID=A0A916ZW13_9RHOB|nr:response regulator [Primorskyibacter flagellatus]GGE16548.1 hypothetical protein GCM10011360_01610 [Primorskyibacter flagellatus]